MAPEGRSDAAPPSRTQTMSQAALPTNPAGLRASLPRLGRWSLILTGVLVPVAIVGLAAGPQAWGYWGDQLGRMHLHAPRLALLARMWRLHPIVIVHMSCAFAALGIGAALMIGVKGTQAHRALGYAWSGLMLVTAVSSFWIQTSGHWSFIHFLSGWTTIAVPLGIALVRRRQVRRHARMMTSVFVGGLLIAGLLTFLPGRLMFALFFG